MGGRGSLLMKSPRAFSESYGTSRRFSRVNPDCASGDPTGATAERGKEYLDLVIERITRFLVELVATPVDSTFPVRRDTGQVRTVTSRR